MESDEDVLEQLERSYRRKRWIATALTVVIVGTAGWASWAYLLRVPSPAAVCGSLYGLVEGHESTEGAKRLTSKLAPFSPDAEDPEARFAETCGVFFSAVRDDEGYAKATRCMTTSWSADAALECFTWEFYTKPGAVAVSDKLDSEPVTYPEEAPELPAGLDAAYEQLVEVSAAALGQCDAVWDADEGCYHYLSAGVHENRRELAVSIPGPIPDPGSGLVLLEATCSFDVQRWVERNPQIRERVASAPIPVQRLVCSYLPTGDPLEANECTAYKPASSNASAGRPGRSGAQVSVPYDPDCADRVVRIEIKREDGEGRQVELVALFKGDEYRPPTPVDESEYESGP